LRHSSSSALSPSQASAAEPEIQPQSADEHSPIKQHEPTKTRSTSRHKHIVENSDENTVENTDASLPAPVPQTPISKVSTSKTQTLRTASLRSRASSLRQSLVSSPSASSPARASTAEPPAEPQGTDERTLLKRDIPSAKTRAATLQSNVENSDEDTEDSQDVPFTGSRAPPLSSKVSVQKPRTSRPSDLRSRTPSAQQSHGVSSGGLNSPQVSTAEPRSEGTPSAQSSTSQASMPTSSSILQTPSSIKHSKINPPSPSVKSPAQANADVRELSQPIRSTQPDAAQGSQRLPPIVVKTRTYALSQQSQENRPPKPRMVIVRLVMTNFKSYAGRQEVGPFHPSFSSVVGPNGSGKSNVIDSLLFVFGFRASKMRQGKISALIHNSGAFSNLDHCEVQVCFQEILDLPQGKYSVIENSELVISRRAFKNNSSKYYINGRTSDYKEVTTLLRSRGIDLDHKRFLILQGEVESIAQMKPKAQGEHDDGLLEYLEDIIGTSQYKKPIEESINQAEELNEVCAEKKNRVKLVEKEMESLEDKKTLALQFINTENQIAMEKCALYQCSLAEDNNNVQLAADMIVSPIRFLIARSKIWTLITKLIQTQLQSQFDAELEKHRGSEEEIEKLKKQTKQAETNIKVRNASTLDLCSQSSKNNILSQTFRK
jgi:structural maintenance of chromosome 4